MNIQRATVIAKTGISHGLINGINKQTKQRPAMYLALGYLIESVSYECAQVARSLYVSTIPC